MADISMTRHGSEKETRNEDDDDDFDDFDIHISGEELDRIGDPRTPSFLKSRDKIVFCLGVINIVCLAFFLHGAPWLMPWYYIFKAPILISIRTYMFFQNKLQYFLIDFCYWANLLVLTQLIFFPQNKHMFAVAYAVSHGPLAWSVCLFRNSLVFHSLDKTTSLFIHVSPLLVTYCIRWVSKDPRYAVCSKHDSDCSSFLWLAVYPLCFYVSWIVVYGFSIRFVCPIPDEDYLTSYRWLTRNKGGPFKFLKTMPFGWLVYGIGNVIVAFLMLCPAILFYNYQVADFLFGVVVCCVAVWNGAGYYIEVFSRKYDVLLARELDPKNK